MPDHHRVIEFLRDVRQGGALQTVTDEITQMAGDYAALCTQANERLRKCSSFLQEGLRSEAIHIAEESPNLLDLVSQLDLPDPQAWAEFCQNNGLAVPPQLQLERAAQLNEAYAQDQPMEHVLAQHRLLALSRAPVAQRLDVMRRIVQLDPGSPHWEKDIRVLEKARLKELPTMFYAAVKNKDDASISRLMDEINRQTWYEPVPAELATAVVDAHSRVQKSSVEAELRTLIEPLRDAFASRSVQECQALIARWKNVMASGGVTTVAPDLMDEIRPVVAFVNEQTKRDDYTKRFRESCKGFTKLLDADAPNAQLEAGYAKLKEFKEEIPEDLTKRYLAKRTDRTKDTDRRHRTRLMMIAGVAVVLIIVGLVVTYVVMSNSSAEGWARQIQAAVNQHSKSGLDEARSHVEKLQKSDPGMLSSPKVAAAVSQLQSLQIEYDSARSSIESSRKKVETAANDAVAVNAKPDATMDEIRAAATGLQAAIQEGQAQQKALAWADADNALATALAGGKAKLDAMRERVVNGARTGIAALRQELSALPANVSTSEAAAELQVKINQLVTRAGALRSLPLLDDAATVEITTLVNELAERRRNADASSGVAAALEQIRTRTGTVTEIQAALKDFTSRFPEDPRTADFKTALQIAPAAQAYDEWLQLSRGFTQLLPGDAAAIKKRIDLVSEFLNAHADAPNAADITKYSEYLTLAAEAMAEKGSWQTAFEAIIASPFMSELTYMEISDGRRIYTMGKDVKRAERRFNEKITVQFEGLEFKDPADLAKTTMIYVESPVTVSLTPKDVPHTLVVADIANAVKLIDEHNWDTYGIDLTERLVKDDKIDVVVKSILVLQALQSEKQIAGSVLGDLYDKTISDLNRLKPADLPWYEPKKMNASTVSSLKQILEAIPAASKARERIEAGKAALKNAVAPDAAGRGVLLKNDAGEWAVFAKVTPPNGSVVWAVQAAAGSSSVVRIASYTGGKYEIDQNAARALPQGSILFLTKP